MMWSRNAAGLVSAAGLLCAVAFVSPAGAMALDPGKCDEAKAAKLVGAPAPSDAEVRKATGATKIRRVKPGQPVTLDFSASRVTLEIENGKVVAARCG